MIDDLYMEKKLRPLQLSLDWRISNSVVYKSVICDTQDRLSIENFYY